MSIKTLKQDIYDLMGRKDGWFEQQSEAFVRSASSALTKQLGKHEGPARLRLSQMGPRCPCALWHSVHKPNEAEKLPPWAEIKYTYGHLIESMMISLVKASGHEVTGEQDELILDGIVGHRDCVIDGATVDIKSTSSRGFTKFKDKTLAQNDDFGYLDQIDGYVVAAAMDPLVRIKDRGYLLAVDKTLGHIEIYEHIIREDAIRRRVQACKEIINRTQPPACTCNTVPDGASGNRKLDTKASYNSYKYVCNPGLRTFLYANGPVYLTKVAKRPQPHIIELDRNGNMVHNYG